MADTFRAPEGAHPGEHRTARRRTGALWRGFRVPVLALILALVAAPFLAGLVRAETLVATWYGPGFEGATTASGEPFDANGYTAASLTYDFGTRLLVTYEGRSVVVRVNDRGPFSGQDLDLSQAAAEYLGITAVGQDAVEVVEADPSTPTGPYSPPSAATGTTTDGTTTDGTTTGVPATAAEYEPAEEGLVTTAQYETAEEPATTTGTAVMDATPDPYEPRPVVATGVGTDDDSTRDDEASSLEGEGEDENGDAAGEDREAAISPRQTLDAVGGDQYATTSGADETGPPEEETPDTTSARRTSATPPAPVSAAPTPVATPPAPVVAPAPVPVQEKEVVPSSAEEVVAPGSTTGQRLALAEEPVHETASDDRQEEAPFVAPVVVVPEPPQAKVAQAEDAQTENAPPVQVPAEEPVVKVAADDDGGGSVAPGKNAVSSSSGTGAGGMTVLPDTSGERP